MLALKEFYKLDYRGGVAMLKDLKDLAKALGLESIPAHNTLWYAHKRLTSDVIDK
jgi:hypothetical protein